MRGAVAAALVLVVAGLVPGGASRRAAATDLDETQVFTGVEEVESAGARRPPAVGYWRVRATLGLHAFPSPVHVAMLSPLSDGRQDVLARVVHAPAFRVEELPQPPNVRLGWSAEGAAPTAITVDYTVRITEARATLPTTEVDAVARPPDAAAALDASEQVQSDAPEVRSRVQALVGAETQLDGVVWALYQYVAAFRPPASPPGPQDARSVLAARRGTSTGRARALVALLRAAGVAARMVGGLRLGNATQQRATSSWVEVWTGDAWVPLDPTNGWFAGLPPSYLALYRDDLPLITHTRGLVIDYGFTVRQTTARAGEESVAAEPVEGGPAAAPDPTRTRSSHVREPVGSVVLIADQSVPEAATDRILEECRGAAIDCVLLSAHFESRYFRERWLERLVASNATLIRRANLVLVATADGAGAFALLGLAERGITLPDARVIVSGDVSHAAARMLGALLWETIRPGEVAFVPRAADVLPLWEMARANLIDGAPLGAEAARWNIDALVLGEPDTPIPVWRAPLLRIWARVVDAGVPLPTLTLILVLPVIATVVVVARLVVGLSTFGLFGPVIVSLAFITTGLWWGTVTFVVLVGLGVLLRAALQRLRLQAPARLGVLVALVAAVMAGLTVVGATRGVGPLLHLSVFPMLIMANVIESFANAQAELGTRQAASTIVSTFALAVTCYLVVDRTGLQSLVLAYPELLLGAVAVDLLLGKWRGLRLLEYRRFLTAAAPAAVARPER